MNRYFSLVILGLTGMVASTEELRAQPAAEHGPDWPDWAYGELDPFSPDDRVAPPCPESAMPVECSYIGAPVPDDGIKRALPDTDLTFTRNEAYFPNGPADWYPGDHPPMPAIVANGREADGIKACALCHYPNGQGKMENGHVSGLPEAYFREQLAAFARGDRRSADPRKANTNEMAMIAANLTETEIEDIVEYFTSMPFRQMVRVVEADGVPQVRVTSNRLMLPLPDLPLMPLGQRIIEVPEDPERTEMSRDPRGGFVAYVPIGSVAKGEALVSTGDGRTIQCGICHGPDQRGVGAIPSIAGRTAGYTMRQLWDMKQGSRKSAIMAPIVANLSAEDMLNIVAYLAGLEP
jgi:cytochrome c553